MQYTRWGNASCPNTIGTEEVYNGTAAGSIYNEGGASNYLCLHDDPEYLQVQAGFQARSRIAGVEYETLEHPLSSVNEYNVPCSVCFTTDRVTELMIPGRITCPPSWTREYYGYIMAARFNHQRSMFVCVDNGLEVIPQSAGDTLSATLHFTDVFCNGIKCPPYVEGYELTCVVCTR